jgi:hypothetical protein
LRHPEAIDYKRLKNETAESYEIEWMAYGRSKLSQILATKVRTVCRTRGGACHVMCCSLLRQALAARFPQSTGVVFYANHPGLVDTGGGF